ncbi:MAG: hypothetical protein MI922_24940, partial [Bacteroidales bacterium]|nr:hypothetical protein [Bacteroidales bacterium]
ATIECTFSHVYSFALIAIFIWLTAQWTKEPLIINSILLGIIFGLISLVRPSNALIILLPLLFGIKNLQELKNRFILLQSNWHHMLIAAVGSFIIWIPQIIYWHVNTGQLFFWSYPGEGFNFFHPHILEGLFGFRKGWLLYTPIMVFAMAGIYFLYKHLKDLFYPVLIITILNIYVILSWWCWWYGSGFGQRSFIDTYALLALPLAVFIQQISRTTRMKKFIIAAALLLTVAINVFYTFKFYYGTINGDSMTKEAFTQYYFKLRPDPQFFKLLEKPDYSPIEKE